MIKFSILGSGPGKPQLDKGLSSIYVECDGTKALMDCGDGTSHKLLENGWTADHLDLVLITHYHPDHVSGFFMLMQMLYLEQRSKALDVYLPERIDFIEDTMMGMYTFRGKFGFDLRLKLIDDLQKDYPQFEAIQTKHLRGYSDQIKSKALANEMKSWSVKVKSPNGDLVYSSDLEGSELSESCYTESKVLIVDALHPAAAQILDLADAKVERVLLNHGVSEELERKLGDLTDSVYEFAREDVEYEI